MSVIVLYGIVAVLAVACIRLSVRLSDLKDLLLWYRKALADKGVEWARVERSRLVAYELEPDLRPGGTYRGGEGVERMDLVTDKEAASFVTEAQRLYQRLRSRR
jgi:hypothetical protein